MNNFFTRLFAGITYISLIAGSILYSEITFIIICFVFFSIAVYESHQLWIKIKPKEGYFQYPIPQLSVILSLIFLISVPFGGLGFDEIYNPYSVLLIFILIWITDTMAYLFGVNCGKNKIHQKYSPNKTWEGFAGGFLCCIIFSVFSFNYIHEIYPLWKTVLLGVFIPIFGLIGDLAQSKVKRAAGSKDSGILIPGHGGLYDRLDSTIGVAPFAMLIQII